VTPSLRTAPSSAATPTGSPADGANVTKKPLKIAIGASHPRLIEIEGLNDPLTHARFPGIRNTEQASQFPADRPVVGCFSPAAKVDQPTESTDDASRGEACGSR
jgi:hypothetical protein